MNAEEGRKRHTRRHVLYCIFAVILLLAAFLAFCFGKRLVNGSLLPSITVSYSAGETGRQELVLYRQKGEYYAFFPACADLSCVCFRSDSGSVTLSKGADSNDLQENVDLTSSTGEQLRLVIHRSFLPSSSYTLHVEQSENLAAMFIETESGSTDYIHKSKDNKERASLVCVRCDGALDAAGVIEIKGHGNTTFDNADKKSYRIKFNERTGLLGMDAAKKWVLISNIYDNSRLRNRVCCALAEQLGLPYAVETDYVDLYINGDYIGNYLVSESVNIAKNRIDIPQTGSFLIEAERLSRGDEPSFYDVHGTRYIIKHPEDLSEDKIDAIRQCVNKIASAIDQLGEEDSLEELGTLIDLDSFAVMFLMHEFTNEIDNNTFSTFYYYSSSDNLLHAGPAWDYDRALGGEVLRGRYYELNTFTDGFPEQLWKNREFQLLVQKKLEERPLLLDDALKVIANDGAWIETSVKMDLLRWGPASGFFIDTGDYSSNTEYVGQYLQKRFRLIEDVVFHPDNYCRIIIENELARRTIWVRKGTGISDEHLAFLCELNKCEGFELADGTRLREDILFFEDTLLLPIS